MFSSTLTARSRRAFAAPRFSRRLTEMLGPDAMLKLAVAISLALHAVLLAVHFRFPDLIARRANDNNLEIVLVNSKSARKPVDAQAKAQNNLDGGGNTDENRRAKTPLPAMRETKSGTALLEAQRRVHELEAQQRKLLTQAKSKQSLPKEERPAEQPPDTHPQTRGVDLAQNALAAIARMEAEIGKSVEEYNKRPRRKQITARTIGVSYAWYFTQWAEKIEKIGSLNYPQQAKEKAFSLMLTVSIREDGTVEKVDIDRSSGNPEVDRQARRIIELAKPFARFTPEMRAEYQIFDIVTTWTFAPGGGMTAHFSKQ